MAEMERDTVVDYAVRVYPSPAVSRRVTVVTVLKTGMVDDYAAYVMAFPDQGVDAAMLQSTAEGGDKLPFYEAERLFPYIEEGKYRR